MSRLSSLTQINRAGTVKIIPEAREELAEPVVWDILHSRMVEGPKTGFNNFKIATEITARGMAVLMVSPTFKPR